MKKDWLHEPVCIHHVERFNGSLKNEFAAYYEDLLFTDVNLFNDKLLDYLV